MKHNVKSVLAILSFFLIVHGASAQSKLDKLMTDTTPEERAELQTNNMRDRLSLSEHQYEQVFEINIKYARKMQSVYHAGQGKLQRLKAMKALGNDKDLELKKVLSTGQYELYREHKEEMRENAKERRNQGR